MADEKILKDEILSDEELDGVAGGTRLETYADGDELVEDGLLSAEDAFVRNVLHKIATVYKDNGRIIDV